MFIVLIIVELYFFWISEHRNYLKKFHQQICFFYKIEESKLMKGKALRKHSLHEKTAASVLLKLFISSYEWCHTTDAP